MCAAAARLTQKLRGRGLTPLEQEFQCKLNVPLGPRWRAGNLAEVPVTIATVWEIELRRVGEVENLRPELQPEALRKREVLEYGQVEIPERRSVVRVVADCALREGRWGGEVRSIEPLRWRAAPSRRGVGVGAGHQVGEAAGPHALATAGADRVRLAGVQRENAVDLPIAEREIHDPTDAGAVRLAAAEGEVVGNTGGEVLADVPRRAGIVQVVVEVAYGLEIVRTAERGAGVGHGMA